MNSEKKGKRRIRLALFAFLAVALAILTVLNILLAVLRVTLYNRDFYVSALTSDNYVEGIYDDLLVNTHISCRVYTIPEDAAPQLIDRALVSMDCQKYAYHIHGCFTGGKLRTMETQLDEKALADTLSALTDSSEFINEDNINNVVIPALHEQYNNTINSLPVNGLTNLIPKLLTSKIISSLNSVYILLICVWVMILCVMFLLRRGKPAKRLYHIFAAGFIPSAIVFAPSIILHGYNLAERLPLGYSPFKTFCDTLINTMLDKLLLYSGIVFAVFAAGLLVTSALLAFSKGHASVDEPEEIIDLNYKKEL